MILLTGLAAQEYTQMLADLRTGRLVRAPEPVAAPEVVRTLRLEPVAEPVPMPPELDVYCRQYGKSPIAYAYNLKTARAMLDRGASLDAIQDAIAAGLPA